MKKNKARWLLITLIGIVCINTSPLTAVAAPPPPIASTPCDTLYYESLSARAWLEAQREITQNQNIILKPDSVLEYTCFDMFLRELSDHAANMLSETTSFGGPMSSSSMDNALQNLVGVSLQAYGSGNFGHGTPRLYALLGGHSAGSAVSHSFSNITGGTYTCDIMARVWQAAKCINFSAHSTFPPPGTPTDGFYTFQEYADITNPANIMDKRHRPQACTSVTLKAQWATNLAFAYVTPPWTRDPMRSYIANITAPTCATSPCRCQVGGVDVVPIRTGIDVKRPAPAPTEYEEKICVQPGCRYNPLNGDVDGNGSADPEGCYAR